MGSDDSTTIDAQAGALGFALTCGAGMCTTIGAAVVFNSKLAAIANKKFLAGSLGVSTGVMLYVSFIEIFFKSQGAFEDADYAPGTAHLLATVCFFSGILLGNLLDIFVHWLEGQDAGGAEGEKSEGGATGHDMDGMFEGIEAIKSEIEFETAQKSKKGQTVPGDLGEDPEAPAPTAMAIREPEGSCIPCTLDPTPTPSVQIENGGPGLSSSPMPHSNLTSSTVPLKTEKLEIRPSQNFEENEAAKARSLVKMGRLTALAIAIHNFPEGLATFVGTVDDPTVGLSLAIAIGIHNIPEGLCVSIPIYYATKDRWLAFKWAFLSGVSEPIGAGLGWAVLANAMDVRTYGVIFGLVAGLMVNICIHELLPTAFKYDPTDKVTSKSVIGGMLVMALSLVLFQV